MLAVNYNRQKDVITDAALSTSFIMSVINNDMISLLDLSTKLGVRGDSICFNIAIVYGNMEAVRYLAHSRRMIYSDTYYETAINHNREDMIDYFISLSWPVSRSNIMSTIFQGKLHLLLKFIKSQEEDIVNEVVSVLYRNLKNIEYSKVESFIRELVLYNEERGEMIWRGNLVYAVFSSGLLDLTIFLKEHGYPCTDDLYDTAEDNLEIYKFIHEVLGVKGEDDAPVKYALIHGSIECFEYLRDNNFLITSEAITEVLYSGSLEAVGYIHEKGYEFDADYEDIQELDDISGDDEVRQYCHDHNLPRVWQCQSGCHFCEVARVRDLESLWIMEEERYANYIQWLPREMLNEIISLVRI